MFPSHEGFFCHSNYHSNYRAVWTLVFSKGHLFDADWLIFCFVLLFCVFFYTSVRSPFFFFFLFSLYHSKRAAVEPSDFFEHRPAFRKTRFFSFWLFAFAFFYFCICLLIFAYPFPTPLPPLGQIGPIVGRTLCHCWSILVDLFEGRLFNEAA